MIIGENEYPILWKIVGLLQACGGLISLVLTIYTSFILTTPQKYFDEIIENFQDSPMMEISERNSISSSCPSGMYMLYFGIWPGTYNGCNCVRKYPEEGCTNKICVGSCSLNETIAGCTNIPPTGPEPIEVWKQKAFCASKSVNKYEELLEKSVKKGEECPIDSKKCGILDYMGNILCFPINQECPINDLIIDKNQNPPPGYDYNTFILKNGSYLHYTNKATEKTIVRSILKEGDVYPCINSAQYHDVGPSYPLNIGGCTTTYDEWISNPYYNKLDSYDKENVFKQNFIYDQLIFLPYYPILRLKNFEYSVSRGVFMGFDKTCKKENNITTYLFAEYSNKYNVVRKLNISASAFSIVLICFECNISSLNLSSPFPPAYHRAGIIIHKYRGLSF